MSAKTQTCPEWCVRHDSFDLGTEDHFGPSVSIGDQLPVGVQLHVDHPSGERRKLVYVGDEDLTAEQARDLAQTLLQMAALLDGGR